LRGLFCLCACKDKSAVVVKKLNERRGQDPDVLDAYLWAVGCLALMGKEAEFWKIQKKEQTIYLDILKTL